MEKNDWLSWGLSLLVHALLLLGFFYVKSQPEPLPVGFVEVEFGPISAGRPVERTNQETNEADLEPQEAVQAQEETQEEVEEEGRRVDLPDQPDIPNQPEEVRTPDTEELGSDTPRTEERERENREARLQQEAQAGGDPDGSAGAPSGDDGTGAEENRTAPYQLEGLEDRILLREVLPRYADQVNAVIQMRIVVDPRGNIVSVTPLRKGNPNLEQAIMTALRRWRFNPLQQNVPQEPQAGVVTFRFRLE